MFAQMEVIVLIILQIFFTRDAVLKIYWGISLGYSPVLAGENKVM